MSNTWVQRGMVIDGENPDDRAGWSVSISSNGSVVAIGAPGNADGGSLAGHVRVYEWITDGWYQRGSDIDGEATNNYSGASISLSSDGTVLAIGAPFNNGSGSGAGHARVYFWTGTAWVQRGTDIDGEAAGDYSGWSVSLSSDGTVLAIGAYGNDGTGNLAGHVRVYTWSGSAWVKRGADIDGEAVGDQSGYSVSLSANGSIVAIGAPTNDGSGVDSGQVRVYEWTGSAWVQRGADINGGIAGDNAGYSVSLSSDGSIVAIGAPFSNGAASAAGKVRVYTWNGSAWVQRGADIDGVAMHDAAGKSVSLSADGSILAVGFPTIEGSGVGIVRTYAWNGLMWLQYGSDIFTGTSGTSFGESVSLSADGTSLAIGAPTNSSGGSFMGQTRIYLFDAYVAPPPGPEPGPGPGPTVEIPCFFGNARVLTPNGYRRMDSLTVGDKVMTPQGTEVAIERVKITMCAASPSTNPYVIPKGAFGATHRTLISPNHKVCLENGRRVEAKHLGLIQEARTGSLTYYNLELTGAADMVVGGVAVESLAPVRRVVMSLADFSKAVAAKYGPANPAILEHIKRTCRFVGKDAVEVPVMRR